MIVHDKKCEAEGVVMGDPGGHGCRCEIRAMKAAVAEAWIQARIVMGSLEDILVQNPD